MTGNAQIAVDVLCVGHASFDLVMCVDHHPTADEKCFASSTLYCGGGPAANAAVTVARLGGASAFAGCLGEDTYGLQHYNELLESGVNVDLVVRRKFPTPLSVVLVKPDGRRTVVNYKADTPFLEEGSVDFAQCHPGVILADGHEPLISLPLIVDAGRKGIPTVLDAGPVHYGTRKIAPLVDYLVASAKFARDFTGESDPDTAIEMLSAFAPCVVITLGEEGLIWKNRHERGGMPAFQVKAMDTTGAGDVFHGAFALGIARQLDWNDTLKYASAAASLCCTRMGARKGIPSGDEVLEYLHANI